MKTSFFSILAATSLLAASASAATSATLVSSRTEQQNPNDRFNDRNSKDFNYGFDRSHKVTPEERKRWEEAHKNDRKEERKDLKELRKDEHKDLKELRKDERKDKDFNYGFDKNHKVTPQERARWEEAHRNDRH